MRRPPVPPGPHARPGSLPRPPEPGNFHLLLPLCGEPATALPGQTPPGPPPLHPPSLIVARIPPVPQGAPDSAPQGGPDPLPSGGLGLPPLCPPPRPSGGSRAPPMAWCPLPTKPPSLPPCFPHSPPQRQPRSFLPSGGPRALPFPQGGPVLPGAGSAQGSLCLLGTCIYSGDNTGFLLSWLSCVLTGVPGSVGYWEPQPGAIWGCPACGQAKCSSVRKAPAQVHPKTSR